MSNPSFLNHPFKLLPAALLSLGLVAACGGSDDADTASLTPEATPAGLTLQKIGGYDGGALGAAEITAFDAASKRLFVVNGANGTVDVLDLSNPAAPVRIGSLNVSALGAGVNSVAVHEGLMALAIEASPKTRPGVVAFYNAATLQLLQSVTVGALPDMLTFTPDGKTLLVANEGEPNSYGLADSVDPEGSVSVLTLNRAGSGSSLSVAATAATADFRAYNGQEAALRAQGVRLFGPGASAAQDLEPEYITVAADGRTAYVTLQENNAIAVVDVATAKVTAIRPLGFKNHSLAGMGLDASDEDGGTNTNSGTPAIKIAQQPVKGMYLPDAIASYTRERHHLPGDRQRGRCPRRLARLQRRNPGARALQQRPGPGGVRHQRGQPAARQQPGPPAHHQHPQRRQHGQERGRAVHRAVQLWRALLLDLDHRAPPVSTTRATTSSAAPAPCPTSTSTPATTTTTSTAAAPARAPSPRVWCWAALAARPSPSSAWSASVG